jgi:UDPglucose--hexose-1-phosphate uridylyltransferase
MELLMPQLRYNIVTGDWVIIAPERSKRPIDFIKEESEGSENNTATYDPYCPFCKGNEGITEEETFRIDDGDAWHLRAVRNKYPALASSGAVARSGHLYHKTISGVGQHDVIIETPAHNLTMPEQSQLNLERILVAYRARMRHFYEDKRIEYVILFKNHGSGAGSSLAHPHSQIVGTPVMPGQVRMRIEEALRHYGDNGICIFCHCIDQEKEDGKRILHENDNFIAFIPYAALSPFHIWVFPKLHNGYFGDITDNEISDLAEILGVIFTMTTKGLKNPDFNLVIRSLSPPEGDVKFFHWYLSIVVRLSNTAGFELGTGMYINSSLPEESAAYLCSMKQ